MSTPVSAGGGERPKGPTGPRRRFRGPDRGPRPLRDGLDEAVDRLVAPGGPAAPSATTMATILSRWEEIAGVMLAGHARPVGMNGGTLVVATDHPARATQVRMMSAELLDRIRTVAGDAPNGITVVVRPETNGTQPPRGSGTVG
ncbi:MAG: DUF721 domain-containing protein [Acidimicrobiales bacterium]